MIEPARPEWRDKAAGVGWTAAFALSTYLLAYLYGAILGGGDDVERYLASVAASAAAALSATLILPPPRDLPRLRAVGLGFDAAGARWFLRGAALGAAGPALILGVGRLAGWWEFVDAGRPESLWWAVLALGALGEELTVRGYAFQQFGRAVSPWGAAGASAALFAYLHAGNPAASSLSALNTGLFGVVFGVALIRSGSLWPPIGLHLGWNLALGVLGAPISGLTIRLAGWEAVPVGPKFWTGGDYGPEGGLAASMVALALAAAAWRFRPNARVESKEAARCESGPR